MRNLKKILALVLALVMSFSLMATANAFTDDKDIDATYDEAVTVLSNLQVFQGYDNGSFQPKGDITRAEVAAIIYRIVTGDVTDAQVAIYKDYNKFDDVKSTSWYAGYVNYCANAKYIKGRDAKTFDPNGKVTGYEALAMILRAVGYDANDEFTGSGWQVQVASVSKSLHITDNVTAGTLGGYAPREVVAELLFRSILVPQVTYSVAFGYQNIGVTTGPIVNVNTGNNTINSAWIVHNDSIGAETFGLEMISGEITAVGRAAGTTTLLDRSVASNGTALNPVTVTNTPADWTDIGYAAYVYTVPTAGAKTREAVSDVVITGESLLVSTDGTSHAALAVNNTKKVTLENTVNVYYNGELTSAATTPTTTAALARVDDRGVKVDYIDNDNGGLVETIVVTEYTPAVVTGKANTTTTGWNAVAADTTYFTTNKNVTTAVKDANVVCDSDLVVDDVVTYVDYRGDRYTTVAPYTADTFKLINRYVADDVSYLIGDATLYASQIAYSVAALVQTNLNTTMGYYVDEYGYIIMAGVVTAPNQYLFGITNAHYNGNTKQAEGYVVLTDGTVPFVNIAKLDGQTLNIENNDITKNMYAYTIGSDGKYTLTTAGTAITSIDYTAGKAAMTLNGAAAFVDNKTVVVDVTNVLAGKADAATVYTGHTGTAQIPSMEDAEGWFIKAENGYVSLMFVYDINVYTADSFYLYDANPFSVTASAAGYQYTFKVVRDGDIATGLTVTLNQTQYEFVVDHGVGYYAIAKNGDISYKSFVELYSVLSWANNTIVNQANNFGVKAAAYTWTDDTTFTVFDVVNKTATNYTLTVGKNYLFNTTSETYGFIDAKNGVAQHVYVVVGPVANGATAGAKMTSDPAANGSVTNYFVCDKYVTGVWVTDAVVHNVYIDNVYYKAVEQATKVVLPVGSANGTGYKLTYTKVDGTNATEYVAYGSEWTVPVCKDGTDIKLESGYVAWTLNGNDPVAVPYSTNGSADGRIADYLTTAGTNVKYEKADGKKGFAASWITPNMDASFEDGYYKVTVTSLNGRNVVLTGTLYNADGTPATTLADGNEYYAKTGAVVKVLADATSAEDATFTVSNADITINIT